MPPIIATLLSQGLGLIANLSLSKGKDFVKQKTGIDLDKAVLSQQDLLTLKKYELEHEEELLKLKLEDNKLGIEELKLYMTDTQDSREREIKVNESANAHVLTKIASPLIAFSTILLTFGLFYLLLFSSEWKSIDQAKKELTLYILGVLSAITTQIFSYYFGSSKGSSEKSDTLQEVIRRVK